MSAPEAQPEDTLRPAVLAQGSLRNVDFRDRVAAVAILSIRPLSTGARYHGVPDLQVAGPAAHIAALGEFLRVVRR
jgi:hypothetical protein